MSTMPSRRSSTVAPTAPDPSSVQGVALGDRQQEFQTLMGRREVLQRRRGQIEARLEVAETTIEECRREAQQYGVASLEELNAFIARQEEAERKSLAEFQSALDAEEQLLQSIESETAAA